MAGHLLAPQADSTVLPALDDLLGCETWLRAIHSISSSTRRSRVATAGPDITTTPTDDGLVLLDERSGRYWQLNTTGTTVLQALLAGKTLNHIVHEFATHYRISLQRAHHDITTLTKHLHAAKLVISS